MKSLGREEGVVWGQDPVLGEQGCVWGALPAPSPCTACTGMVFPSAWRAMEEFAVVAAHQELSQALLMDGTAHSADPRVSPAWLHLLWNSQSTRLGELLPFAGWVCDLCSYLAFPR